MSRRHFYACLTLTALLSVLGTACSNPPADSAAGITGPTPAATMAAVGGAGGVLHPLVVNFPPRADGVDFRRQLESKYTGMGRRTGEVYVDQDGEATWVGEYMRYRVNGCDHDTATQRTLAQVDGAPPAQICSPFAFPETAVYPPRDHVVDFRRQLGAKYQAMGRTAQSAVDPDGAAIWLSEYYRYRTSGCDHATATQNTMVQIDGQPAPPSCVVACAYYTSGQSTAPGDGGTFSVQLIRTSGSCNWIADSDSDWLTVNRPITGGDRSFLSYSVAANTGSARNGRLRFSYPGGTSYFDVNQGSASYNLQFQMFDPAVSSTTPATECKIRTTGTLCTLQALTSRLPPAAATFDWRVEYAYNGSKVRTQVGSLTSFSFTETCGPAPPEGAIVPITVKLIAADGAGNSATIFSGEGSQPALQLRVFSCP